MKMKKWIWMLCVLVFFSVCGSVVVIMTGQVQGTRIPADLPYIESTSVSDADGTYKSVEFDADQDGLVRIWFENQGTEAAKIQLIKKEGIWKKEQRTAPMVVPSDQPDGSYLKACVEKGETYFVIVYTELGSPISGRLKVRPILGEA